MVQEIRCRAEYNKNQKPYRSMLAITGVRNLGVTGRDASGCGQSSRRNALGDKAAVYQSLHDGRSRLAALIIEFHMDMEKGRQASRSTSLVPSWFHVLPRRMSAARRREPCPAQLPEWLIKKWRDGRDCTGPHQCMTCMTLSPKQWYAMSSIAPNHHVHVPLARSAPLPLIAAQSRPCAWLHAADDLDLHPVTYSNRLALGPVLPCHALPCPALGWATMSMRRLRRLCCLGESGFARPHAD